MSIEFEHSPENSQDVPHFNLFEDIPTPVDSGQAKIQHTLIATARKYGNTDMRDVISGYQGLLELQRSDNGMRIESPGEDPITLPTAVTDTSLDDMPTLYRTLTSGMLIAWLQFRFKEFKVPVIQEVDNGIEVKQEIVGVHRINRAITWVQALDLCKIYTDQLDSAIIWEKNTRLDIFIENTEHRLNEMRQSISLESPSNPSLSS